MKSWHQFAAVIAVFIGTVIISMVFGMLIFGVFTAVCATNLLHVAAKVGYVGVLILLAGLLLETYALYEHHRKHVMWLAALSVMMSIVAAGMIHFSSVLYSC